MTLLAFHSFGKCILRRRGGIYAVLSSTSEKRAFTLQEVRMYLLREIAQQSQLQPQLKYLVHIRQLLLRIRQIAHSRQLLTAGVVGVEESVLFFPLVIGYLLPTELQQIPYSLGKSLSLSFCNSYNFFTASRCCQCS